LARLLSSIASRTSHVRTAAGQVLIGGRALAAWPAGERARHIGFLAQDRMIGWDLAVRHVVALGRVAHHDRNPADAPAAVDEALAATGTAHLADRPVLSLSGGERARVLLARALAGRPRVLLADEPTASLDPRYQLAAMRILREAASRGVAGLVVLHDLSLAAQSCDRVAIMEAGRLAAYGPPTEAMTRERLACVFGIEVFEGMIEGRRMLVPWRES
jgi:iron complex transport system ATP-binding protein